LRELARIFITANSMMPMTKHEKRILNYNVLNRWLNDICLRDTNIKDMFESIGSGMNGEYSLTNKGDTLFVAEMLLYINNNKYEGYDTSVLDDVFGSYPKGKFLISDADRDMTKKIMKIMADGCVSYDKKKLKKFTKSSFYNLFYTISFILQKGNIWSKKFDIDGRYKVIDDKLFIRWFFDQEFARINALGTHISFQTPLGKTKKQVHDWSFSKHNADQNHSRKESVKGEGGSKFTFTEWARVQYLLQDLKNALTDLEKSNIITKVGSRTTMSRDAALVALNVPLSKSDNIHIDEIVPVSRGGNRVIGNIQALNAKTNSADSNRIRRGA
jgi:hypothetical protein